MTCDTMTPLKAATIIGHLADQRGGGPEMAKAMCAEFFAASGWEMPDDYLSFVTEGKLSDRTYREPDLRGVWIGEAEID